MYIKRNIEKEIERVLNRKEIIALIGARQVGKTTTILRLLDNLEDKKINKISFDDIEARSIFKEDIESFIEIYVRNYDILFIDEIQYVRESGEKLKYIYDKENIKIIISGSSSTEISIQTMRYLVGRIFIFTLYSFNFEEFLLFKRPELIVTYKKGDYKETIVKQLNREKSLFMQYGGYPAVVTEKNRSIKEVILKNIYNTYLLKEIKDLLHLSESDKLIKLLKILAIQTGTIINYSTLSLETGFSVPTLKKYLNILEQTFIIKLIKPFFTNKKKELVKNPKIYFIDPGFRNACIYNFSKELSNTGQLQEQFVFNELIKKGFEPKFWNTKTKAEVDVILEIKNKPIPIEIKTTLKQPKKTRSYHNFLKEYNPEKSFILSENLEEIDSNTQFLPIIKINKIIKEL